jgi:hypothetical protein
MSGAYSTLDTTATRSTITAIAAMARNSLCQFCNDSNGGAHVASIIAQSVKTSPASWVVPVSPGPAWSMAARNARVAQMARQLQDRLTFTYAFGNVSQRGMRIAVR